MTWDTIINGFLALDTSIIADFKIDTRAKDRGKDDCKVIEFSLPRKKDQRS